MKKPRDRQLRSRPRQAIGALCLVQFVDVLGVTVVITALPAMLRGLHAAPAASGVLVTGYAMSFGGLLMLGARLGDRFGHRRVLSAGLVSFGVASVLAATATSVATLVGARCLQGAAAALSVPTALRLLLAVTDQPSRRRALAAWSAAGAAAGGSGFLLGGVLTELVGWRALFWMNLPLAGGLLAGVLRVPPCPGRRGQRLDLAGAATLTTSVMAVVAGASLLGHPAQRALGIVALATGAALLAAFGAIERHADQPLLPVAAVRDARLRVAAGAAALNTATTGAAATLATLYLQDARGFGPAKAGLLLLPFSVVVVAGAAFASPLLSRRSPQTGIALGLATIGAGIAILLALPVAPWLLPAAFAVCGFGIGISSVAANALGTQVAPELQGVASGALNTAAQMGTALGVSLLVLLATTTRGTNLPVTGAPLAWATAAAMALGGALLARPRRHGEPAARPCARLG